MKKIALTLLLAVTAGVAYLCLWPVPVRPLVWTPPVDSGYTGVHAPNNRLALLQTIPLGSEEGPEHVALAPDGILYAAMASGNILRMNPDGRQPDVFVNTGGRVLGFDFDAAGNLIAADAIKGLLSISRAGQITLLANQVQGNPIGYADAVVVARNGKIYFSDASTRFAPADWGGTFKAGILDIFEQSSTGRILEYDPVSASTRIVAHGLSFANGVALSQNQRTLFVSESGKYRVWKIAVAADKLDVASVSATPSAQASILLDNLPGFPDNLMRGLDGRIWLGFARPRHRQLDAMAAQPWLRKFTLRLPRALWPVAPAYGHVIAFTENGKIVADLQDPSGAYPDTTGITETRARFYVHSLSAQGLGWLVH
jgi:sugar lactone lactonase YvrE